MSKKLSTRSMGELKLIAKEKGIDVEGLKKAQIVEVLEAEGAENVITSNTIKPSGVSTTSAVVNNNGVLVSPQPERVKTVPSKTDPNEGKVAIYSDKNLSWSGVGKLSKGYNFVTKEVAEKWLVHKAVRDASPEEVAAHYGIN